LSDIGDTLAADLTDFYNLDIVAHKVFEHYAAVAIAFAAAVRY